MKIKTIRLSDGHAPADLRVDQAKWDQSTRYRVEQITDSVRYRTGQLLDRAEVLELCDSKQWKVTIVPMR